MSTETKYPLFTPEIWGGVECTINRVNNTYRDQLSETGHYSREGDIGALASSGIRKMRYPILWEKHKKDPDIAIDWKWSSARLSELRSKDITPIAGLLHHGSGPAYTDLTDPLFPEKLAAYAGQVAAQFPWLEYYTPVNEPLTTARFSGLYGYWYPHQQNDRSFAMMLLNQVKGIILSMQAIRKINPAAKLVQTEDLCKIHSTQALAYQADFENHRRWLTGDLLCGYFKPGHALWNYFLSLRIPEKELLYFAANPCPPDIMGFNYYITSERFLDDRLKNYSPNLHGGNDSHRYTDTDAARMNCRDGLEPLLTEAWRRYQLPLAITECHLNCGREDQMRWLKEVWDTCISLNRNGIPVKAVTAWSLLGSYDWDSLLLQHNRHYESGAFDISGGGLRPTILVKMIRAYAKGKLFDHPVLHGAGWWHHLEQENKVRKEISPMFIIGQDMPETRQFIAICSERRIFCQHFSPDELHGDRSTICRYAEDHWPWAIAVILQQDERRYSELFEWLATWTSGNGVLLLVVNNTMHHQQDVWQVSHENLLLIQPGNTGDTRLNIQQALDLLIDGERGHWVTGVKRPGQIVLPESALA